MNEIAQCDRAAGLAGLRAIGEMGVNDGEKALLSQEQVDCPVFHRFGPGIYIREVHIPAGTIAIGHRQRFEQMNVMLKGRVTVINDDGTYSELVAPMCFVGKPGRKVGYVHEDMVWQNIYATEETNVETLEATFLDKSEFWLDYEKANAIIDGISREADREDYKKMLRDVGITHEIARAQSENTDDMSPIKLETVIVAGSAIEGRGLFATTPIGEGELIAPARIAGKRTVAGRFTNHAKSPNAKMVATHGGDIALVAIRGIRGCQGGRLGDEITIDYRQAIMTTKEASLCLL